MSIDAKIGPLAKTLVGKFGKSITLTRVVPGAYDVTTGTTTNVETQSTIKAVVEEYKGIELKSELIQQGDKKITVPASGLTAPNLADKLVIDGITFAIISLQNIYSGASIALYILQGRKA